MSKTTGTKKRSGTARKSSTSSKMSLSKILSDLKQPAVIGAGFVGGKYATAGIDKLMDAGSKVSGFGNLDGLSSFVKPAILVGGALVGRRMAKKPMVKDACLGVAIYGLVDGMMNVIPLPAIADKTATNSGKTSLPPSTAPNANTTNTMGVLPAGFNRTGNYPLSPANVQ